MKTPVCPARHLFAAGLCLLLAGGPGWAQPAAPAGFVLVPGGTFTRGGEEGDPRCQPDENPRHQVTLSPFWLASHEVTQELFSRVTGRNPSYFTLGPDHPLDSVTWYEAVAFCNALSALEGLAPAYQIAGRDVAWDRSAPGYRLPTEAEWEFACRAGTQTPFVTGNCLAPDQANFNGYEPLPECPLALYRAQTVPVGSFEANPPGLFDLHGNVFEWCWDWYGEYHSGPAVDPAGPASGANRITRGGGWISFARGCRSAKRYGLPPGFRRDYLGFRLARAVPAGPPAGAERGEADD